MVPGVTGITFDEGAAGLRISYITVPAFRPATFTVWISYENLCEKPAAFKRSISTEGFGNAALEPSKT